MALLLSFFFFCGSKMITFELYYAEWNLFCTKAVCDITRPQVSNIYASAKRKDREQAWKQNTMLNMFIKIFYCFERGVAFTCCNNKLMITLYQWLQHELILLITNRPEMRQFTLLCSLVNIQRHSNPTFLYARRNSWPHCRNILWLSDSSWLRDWWVTGTHEHLACKSYILERSVHNSTFLDKWA